MSATINSLGIGSGVLTADVIDKLKAADTTGIITPLDNKIALNTQKQTAYSLLSSLMTTFRTSSSNLSSETTFANKNVNVSGSAEVSLSSGANVDSFTLETTTLAKKDITKFGAFVDKSTTPVASGAGVLKINNYSIPYTATTTLSELAQAITDKAGTDIAASILQTGTGAFNLVVSSKATGAGKALTIEDTLDGTTGTTGFLSSSLFNPYDATTNPNGYQKVQTATDASFKFNGIVTTRPTNNVTDLVYGLNITLKKEGDTSSVNITQNTTKITDELKLFVDGYNALATNLKDSTTTNTTAKTEGVFVNSTFVKSIGRDLLKTITAVDSDGKSMTDYGLTLDKDGKMSFDKSVVDAKLSSDPDALKLFFAGGVTSNGVTKTGLFSSITDKIKSYTDSGKLFSNFSDSLKSEATSLTKNKTNAQKSLDARYETMTKKFGAYDSLISKATSNFSSLKMMIQTATATTNN